MFATGLETVPTHELMAYLEKYMAREAVDTIVVGKPLSLQATPTDASPHVEGFVRRLVAKFPLMPIVRIDERFSSVIAERTIAQSGMSKSGRRKKGLVDTLSAVVILQSYLEQPQR